ncbi:MAG: serine hydrolase [Acidobacteriota bacterium]
MFLRHPETSCIAALLLLVSACSPSPEIAPLAPSNGSREQVIARGESLELDTEYVPPPGEPLHHHTAGFAKILCSGVFITGLDEDDAAANVGGFISPFEEREEVVERVVDVEAQSVSLTLPDGVVRTASRYESQGCVAHPIGGSEVFFEASTVVPDLPPAETTPWPMGDVLTDAPWPEEIDRARIEEALDLGFGPPEARTLGLVVTYKGRILGERYGEGIDLHTPLESWSMTKTLTGTLVGVLIEQGTYDLWQPAPIPEWQTEGDPRQEIRIGDILSMSSGIRINAPADPDYDASLYADHYYLYTGTMNSYEYAATRPQQWPPDTVGRYRNTDPVLASYLVRLGVEGRGDDYHSFPQRALFDRLGIRDGLIETDPYGNFLGQGLSFMAARDWARLGNLYLQDGVWEGERILPEGYVEWATTPAPAWVADGRPIYGGSFLWVGGDSSEALPGSAYQMLGAGGQSTTVLPEHGLVVVRLGKYTGAQAGGIALDQAFEKLLEAVPPLASDR